MQVRALPVLQNWDCHSCGDCCRSYAVPVTAEERRRIEAQGWERLPEFQGVPYFVKRNGEFYLNHRADGGCVFLGADKLCRIHGQFGSAAKPLACRIYPFLLVPAGDHWNFGLRLACPSAAENKGRPLSAQAGDARQYADFFESTAVKGSLDGSPPPLYGNQSVGWGDVGRIATAFSKLLANGADPFERRWRKLLFVVSMLRKAKFDGGGDPKKAVVGGRLSELLHVLGTAAEEEEPAEPGEVARPGWVGRTVFRQLVALFARKDHGAEKGEAQRGPVRRFASAVRFATGRGRVPKVHAVLTDGATFAAGERPLGALGADAVALLTRWHRLKVESLQFCGAPNFGLSVWDGIESLALTFPAAMWLARVLVAGGTEPGAAVTQAVRMVDDNFGFNPLFGSARQKFALRLIAARGDLPKLVAWYGR
ncbi:YkgJ family cysteine cluster protein [Gemmata sp. JC673]|uniref:YkgJ family cysteine cluster protein n=1 Tax=Gemmata algarum TaxID=2975278 RepID=A0ABU5EWC7_9BACT|nr:YkgJ family cysteine cluster protein [Gemmata algarum]MDY3559525.1 YkgJ family cysteine cluster protein [Gemmata algarum]